MGQESEPFLRREVRAILVIARLVTHIQSAAMGGIPNPWGKVGATLVVARKPISSEAAMAGAGRAPWSPETHFIRSAARSGGARTGRAGTNHRCPT
jgi:hypothetical protein